MVEYVLQRIAGTAQVDAVYFDLAKAFDKVDHEILLRKLHNFGVGHNIVKRLRSYLVGRHQAVMLETHESRLVPSSPRRECHKVAILGLYCLLFSSTTSVTYYLIVAICCVQRT